MDRNNNITEETELKNILKGFIVSYVKRDKSVDFSTWLAERIQKEIPYFRVSASREVSRKIIEAVGAYDKTLDELNKAIESGQSKEEWLADRMAEFCADMSVGEAGNRLQEIDNDWNTANALLMGEIENTVEETAEVFEAEIMDNLNEYSLKKMSLDIGNQAVMFGLGSAANIIKNNIENGEVIDVGDVIGQVLQVGVETAAGEVKAVVTGAVKATVEKGLINILPYDTPIENICDISCLAVESAGALFDVATGKTTMTEALDRSGRASVAAACRWCAGALKAKMALIPVVGPLVVNLAGGLLEHMKSPKFTENVYTVVHDAAIATWEGIKESTVRIWNKIKNFGKKLLQ